MSVVSVQVLVEPSQVPTVVQLPPPGLSLITIQAHAGGASNNQEISRTAKKSGSLKER
jgi:hypothetical protein